MTPNREAPQAIEDRGIAKAKYARFFWPVLHGMVFIAALCAFIPFLAGMLYGEKLGTGTVLALGVFLLASFALGLMAQPFPARPSQLGFSGWSVVGYFSIIGLGFNWACAFLWFSRRYTFFSIPVMTLTASIVAVCAVIALLVFRLTGANWRKALAVFLFAEIVPAVVVLRLGLLR
jgi:hypothetical protein